MASDPFEPLRPGSPTSGVMTLTPGRKRPVATQTHRVSGGWYVAPPVPRPSRLFELFAWKHGPDVEIVGVGNFVAACGVGVALYAWQDLSFSASAAAAAIAFVLFTVLLLHRVTFWISAVVGGLATAVVPALMLAGVGAMFFDGAGLWVGAGLGIATGLGVALSSYRAVFRTTRSSMRP